MKENILIITMILITNLSFAQLDLDYFNYDKKEFISPSIENLVKGLNATFDDWKSELKGAGFRKMDDKDGIFIYINGEVGKISQLMSKAKKEGVVIIQWYDLENKKVIMEDIEKKIVNNYAYTEHENKKYYIVKYLDTDYLISIERTPDYGMEEILIRKAY